MRFKIGSTEFTGDSVAPLMVRGFRPGGADVRIQDSDEPTSDGILAGVDLLGGRLWEWDLSARGANLGEVLALNATLEKEWRVATRLKPGVNVPLSYELNGRWRRVYGRPGRYSGVEPDFIAMSGVGHIACDFRVLDPLHYDDDDTNVVLTIVPASVGGMMTPFVFPLSTYNSTAPRAGTVNNLGDANTPLKVKFQGPVTDPWVRSSKGMEIALKGTLAYDESVTIDPLAGTVTRNTGEPAGGLLTRKTRLSATLMKPGVNELTFGGIDATGTAKATLSWRNAYNSI